jgi:hypothetical protein
MEFWFSGELDHQVSDAYREIRKEVEASLNRELASKDYGPALQRLAIIPIITSKTFHPRKERRLVQREQKSADYRLFIDFEAFLAGDHHKRVQLLVASVLLAVQDIERKLKSQFAGVQLRNDIKALFPSAGAPE